MRELRVSIKANESMEAKGRVWEEGRKERDGRRKEIGWMGGRKKGIEAMNEETNERME